MTHWRHTEHSRQGQLPSHHQVDLMLTNRHGEAKKVKLAVQVTHTYFPSGHPNNSWTFPLYSWPLFTPDHSQAGSLGPSQPWPLRHLSRTLAWHSLWYFLVWSGMDLISAVEAH